MTKSRAIAIAAFTILGIGAAYLYFTDDTQTARAAEHEGRVIVGEPTIVATDVPQGYEKLITPVKAIDLFLDIKHVAIMTKPQKFRFAETVGIFKTPAQIDGELTAAYTKVSAYDCEKRETTLIVGIFLDSSGLPIKANKRAGDPIKVDPADTTSTRAAELDAVCKMDPKSMVNVDGPSGYQILRDLFFGPSKKDKKGIEA